MVIVNTYSLQCRLKQKIVYSRISVLAAKMEYSIR